MLLIVQNFYEHTMFSDRCSTLRHHCSMLSYDSQVGLLAVLCLVVQDNIYCSPIYRLYISWVLNKTTFDQLFKKLFPYFFRKNHKEIITNNNNKQ